MSPTTPYLIDTGILIREIRRVPQATALLRHLAGLGIIVISPISAFEIEAGARQSDKPDGVYARIPSVVLTRESAVAGARLMRLNQGVFGTAESIPDALIAGTAISYGAKFVTLNTRQFSRINHPDLEIILIDQTAPDWTAAVP